MEGISHIRAGPRSCRGAAAGGGAPGVARMDPALSQRTSHHATASRRCDSDLVLFDMQRFPQEVLIVPSHLTPMGAISRRSSSDAYDRPAAGGVQADGGGLGGPRIARER